MVLDEINRQLITKNKIIKLSKAEFLFICYLIQHKNETCSYNEIIKFIYKIDDKYTIYYQNAFKVMLRRIKKKLKNEDLIIITVRKFGIFSYYNIDEIIKKRFRNFNKELKINQLEKEIMEKEQEILKIKESFE